MHCSNCGAPYTAVTLPFTCTTPRCGHVLQAGDAQPPDPRWLAAQFQEDLRVFDIFASLGPNKMLDDLNEQDFKTLGNIWPRNEN